MRNLISEVERVAFTKFLSNFHIFVFSVDKVNVTFVLDLNNYNSKISALLEDWSHNPIARDLTSKFDREIMALISKFQKIYFKIQIPPVYIVFLIFKCSRFLFRSIVNLICSLIYAETKYWAKIVRQNKGKTFSNVLNSSHYVSLISNVNLKWNDLLISFDVTSFPTKVPILDNITIVEFLSWDEKLSDHLPLVKKCPTSTYCLFQGKLYQQTSGNLTGSLLFPVVTELFMEAFEVLTMESFCLKFSYDISIILSSSSPMPEIASKPSLNISISNSIILK